MPRAVSSVLECLYFGFDESNLFLRIDLHSSIFEPPDSLEVEILFPGKNRKISTVLYPADPSLRVSIGNIGEILRSEPLLAKPDTFRAAVRRVLELGIPFRELGCE